MAVATTVSVAGPCILAGIFILYFLWSRRTQPESILRTDAKTAPVIISHSPNFPDQALPPSIFEADEASINRHEWVKRLTHHVYHARHGGRYNVLTINKGIDYHFLPVRVVERFLLTYDETKKARVIPYELIL